jgi:coproporphyrinogen III oxidase-like Fe-S oxidoreductase
MTVFAERLKSQHDFHNILRQVVTGPGNFTFLADTLPKCDRAALYIHVPFCSKICTFCNMLRHASPPVDDYADLLAREMVYYAQAAYVQNDLAPGRLDEPGNR